MIAPELFDGHCRFGQALCCDRLAKCRDCCCGSWRRRADQLGRSMCFLLIVGVGLGDQTFRRRICYCCVKSLGNRFGEVIPRRQAQPRSDPSTAARPDWRMPRVGDKEIGTKLQIFRLKLVAKQTIKTSAGSSGSIGGGTAPRTASGNPALAGLFAQRCKSACRR